MTMKIGLMLLGTHGRKLISIVLLSSILFLYFVYFLYLQRLFLSSQIGFLGARVERKKERKKMTPADAG